MIAEEEVNMSSQFPDYFIWDKTPNKSWCIVDEKTVSSIFNPQKFGLCPYPLCTGCYKGFNVKVLLKNRQLYLDELEIHCKDGKYPVINGVLSKKQEWWRMHLYENLNLPLYYTGKIIIGYNLKNIYARTAFLKPDCYYEAIELEFNDGKLIDYKNVTG